MKTIRVWNRYGTKIKEARVSINMDEQALDERLLLLNSHGLAEDEAAYNLQVRMETETWQKVAKKHTPLTKDLIHHISKYLVKNRPLERGDRHRYPKQDLIWSWQNDARFVFVCIVLVVAVVVLILLMQTLVYFSAPMNSIVLDCNTMPGPTSPTGLQGAQGIPGPKGPTCTYGSC